MREASDAARGQTPVAPIEAATGRPWYQSSRRSPMRQVIEAVGENYHIATVEGKGKRVEADARLIVTAVNVHDELVGALRVAVEMLPCYTEVGADLDDDCCEDLLCPACGWKQTTRALLARIDKEAGK